MWPHLVKLFSQQTFSICLINRIIYGNANKKMLKVLQTNNEFGWWPLVNLYFYQLKLLTMLNLWVNIICCLPGFVPFEHNSRFRIGVIFKFTIQLDKIPHFYFHITAITIQNKMTHSLLFKAEPSINQLHENDVSVKKFCSRVTEESTIVNHDNYDSSVSQLCSIPTCLWATHKVPVTSGRLCKVFTVVKSGVKSFWRRLDFIRLNRL